MATEPKLLLLDEPAAGMNPNETQELMDTIRFIRDHFDLTILLIEHDMKLVGGICESFIKSNDAIAIFSNAFTFALLIVVLLFKPTGMFGEAQSEKV